MIKNLRRRRQHTRNLSQLRDMIRHSPTQSARNDLLTIAARTDPGTHQFAGEQAASVTDACTIAR